MSLSGLVSGAARARAGATTSATDQSGAIESVDQLTTERIFNLTEEQASKTMENLCLIDCNSLKANQEQLVKEMMHLTLVADRKRSHKEMFAETSMDEMFEE
jgi:hypothetical protein